MARKRSSEAFLKALGFRMKAARITSGYESGADIAKILKIDQSTYRKYERGESSPSVEDMVTFAQVTNYSLDWLLAKVGEARRPPKPPSA